MNREDWLLCLRKCGLPESLIHTFSPHHVFLASRFVTLEVNDFEFGRWRCKDLFFDTPEEAIAYAAEYLRGVLKQRISEIEDDLKSWGGEKETCLCISNGFSLSEQREVLIVDKHCPRCNGSGTVARL